jgi:hypothetical protein
MKPNVTKLSGKTPVFLEHSLIACSSARLGYLMWGSFIKNQLMHLFENTLAHSH